jgi:ATP-dependent exoDNAse (exonuclease V) beta subunit
VLADERGRWILSETHVEAATELRLSAHLEGQVVNVALDRTFVDAQGTRWIVDYKTGLHEGGNLEGFLDREQERYRTQLERYARVLRNLDSREVRVALYFPLLQAWREWVPEAG